MKNSRKETINGRKTNEKITFQLTLSLADKEIKEKVRVQFKNNPLSNALQLYFYLFKKSFGWNQMLYNPVLVADRWDPKSLL